MHITHFTDLGLRVLMYLAIGQRNEPVTISEIAEQFHVSRNHLVKVVHRLGQLQWVATTRGKGGGLALAAPPHHYRLGTIIRTLEECDSLVDCQQPPCVLLDGCTLKQVLDEALHLFYQQLDRYTLADVMKNQTATTISELQRGTVIHWLQSTN